MKKVLILFTLLAVVLVSCDDVNEDGSHNTGEWNYFRTIVVDSCEYVRATYRLAHKGNCKFCKERRKKEREQLKREIIEELKKK